MAMITLKFVGVNNVDDPLHVGQPDDDRTRVRSEVIKSVNCDNDPEGRVRRRKGKTLSVACTPSSGWSPDGITAYLVDGTALKTFNGTALSASLATVTANLPMAFCQVNDIIVFSNGSEFGIIENGTVATPFTPTDEDKQRTVAGQLVEFYNGRLYVFRNGTLYCSDDMDNPGGVEQMDTRRNVVVEELGAYGTMLKAVDDGIWLGTEKEAGFLKGSDPFVGDGFSFEQITPYGVAFGSAVSFKGELAGLSGNAVIWTSERGFCIGGNGGAFKNLSQDKVSPEFGDGAGMVREQDGLVHYICSMTQKQTAYNRFSDLNLTIN